MSSRGHEREEVVAGVRQVSGAGHYSAMTAGSVDILKNREKNSPKNFRAPSMTRCRAWQVVYQVEMQ